MGVKLWEGGFRSHRAAHLAGKQALEDFLNGLSLEAGSRSFSWRPASAGIARPPRSEIAGTEIAGMEIAKARLPEKR
jgi:hypothetical protein